MPDHRITTTRKFDGSRHTGYVVTGDDMLLATVTEGRRGGYFTRCYISPDECSITQTAGLLDARDIAERHALAITR